MSFQVGPLMLYFGNRYKGKEFLYQEELEKIAASEARWFTLRTVKHRSSLCPCCLPMHSGVRQPAEASVNRAWKEPSQKLRDRTVRAE